MPFEPPPRLTKLRSHPVQSAYWRSPHRFNVVPAGRRSGKTEILKRKLVRACARAFQQWAPRFFVGAPTRDQAKRIYWEDLKALSPRELVKDISESDLCITYLNDAQLWVLGMDKPERVEGSPWDGAGLDEYGNMKPTVWTSHVRPALSDRKGWCDFIGVPEGRNHYYKLYKRAVAMMKEFGERSEWGAYTWKSADILDADEIEAARRDLDELTFAQEYEASFVNFEGRAYYPFDDTIHCAALKYDPKQPLILCFDFNVAPGIAVVCQEQKLPNQFEHDANGHMRLDRPLTGTGVIGEVWIPRNSNTPAVCRRLIADWGKHEGRVACYGDATGGAKGSAKVEGSDWDLIERELRPIFKNRLSINVPDANPKERSRVNALNSRLRAATGDIRLMVDPSRAPHVIRDLEGVTLLEGGSGEIDKDADPELTHPTDALGYYVVEEFPIDERGMEKVRLGGI